MLKRCDSKKVFGVTIHKNMSASELKEIWDNVPKDKRDRFPELTNVIAAAALAGKLVDNAIPIYENAKKALKAQEEVVLTAAASSAGNVTYPITKAAEAVAKTTIEKAATSAVDKVKSAIETIANKMAEAGGCRQEGEDSESPNVTKENKSDQL